MRLADFIKNGTAALEAQYGQPEARSIMLTLCKGRLGTENYTHILYPETEIPQERSAGLDKDLGRLLKGEPVQYVLGKETFCGREFRVGPGVLIPRPETEILVGEAVNFGRSVGCGCRVLDLCTGSGCIAWSIFKELPCASVTGVDVSDIALDYARGQFDGDSPLFEKYDVLDTDSIPDLGKFNLIVSNPPYIMESERAQMQSNVLDYEPAIALFVPDSDPLVFYRAIAAWAEKSLVSGGYCIVEINEALPEQTAALFRETGFVRVRVVDDLAGKARFICFFKS